MNKLLAALCLVATPALSDGFMNGVPIDCYCTDSKGQRIEIGETICLQVDGRMFMAQCQMSLNVPIWREIAPGCVSSDLKGGQSLDPTVNPRGIDPHVTPPKA
ncbi:hypothetical protein [Shimia aestuarii]|uniref:Uncharacterized protein n=1 Tax=Shimia aestuarii TaxID=254406 RepID=A0A1I4P6Z9_9RHOB|nr:hypothetical protein SAMN04488042_105107 [Shimia aestuarii]